MDLAQARTIKVKRAPVVAAQLVEIGGQEPDPSPRKLRIITDSNRSRIRGGRYRRV